MPTSGFSDTPQTLPAGGSSRAVRKENSDFQTGFLSEAGTALKNKDYFAFVELEDKACWALADSLDRDKETLSAEIAVKSVLSQFLNKPTISRRLLEQYVLEAHRILQEESLRVRLKSSLIVVVTDYRRMVWVSVGNCRMYHFRNSKLHARSSDLSLSQQLVSIGQLPDDALDRHEERHNLLHYLGKPDGLVPFVSKKQELADGDVLVLCSPGLWEAVDSTEMQDVLEEAKEPAAMVDMLEEVLLSRQRRIVPNYTAAAIFANKVFVEKKRDKKKWVKLAVMTLIPLLLFGGGAFYFRARAIAQKAESVAAIVEHEKSGDEYVQESDYAKAVSEYSEARNASIKVKDKIHTELLGKKLKLSQLIVDGDASFKEGDYAKAQTQYEKAIADAKYRSGFDTKDLKEKLEKIKSYTKVQDQIKEADLKLQGQDYRTAKELYQKAKTAAIIASFAQGEKEAAEKLTDADAKLAGLEKESRQLEGDKLEKKGDSQFAIQDYMEAVNSYAKAQEIYQEIGMLEKVLSMERKITKADDKLNPPVAKENTASAAQPDNQAHGDKASSEAAAGSVGEAGQPGTES
jgi:serine/threonine protein phosphatase PrpC